MTTMTLTGIVMAIAILALVLLLIGLVPIDARAKQILYIVAVVLLLLWLVQQLGGFAR